jgi:hypothetical protein
MFAYVVIKASKLTRRAQLNHKKHDKESKEREISCGFPP